MAGVEIYSLTDPRNMQVCYIGKANDSVKRLKSHLRDARRRFTPVYAWINELSDLGLSPTLTVLASVSPAIWPETEIAEILKAKEINPFLLNVAKGGNEPGCSTQTRAKNGRKNANAIHSDMKRKRVWAAKQKMGLMLKWLVDNGRVGKLEQIKAKLKIVAQKDPVNFGCYASI